MLFGLNLVTGWDAELLDQGTTLEQWAKIVEIAQLVDALDYDALLVSDHFRTVPSAPEAAVFECFTTLGALTQITSRVRIGELVSCALFRHPSVVAKMTACLDVMSGGRTIFGVGAGWNAPEGIAYGYDWPPTIERVEMVEESIQIVRSMWSDLETSYNGRHFKITNAVCEPKPIQQPHPPILVGGSGPRHTLHVVARHADIAHLTGSPEEFATKVATLRNHCRVIGRDADEITITWGGGLLVAETEDDLRRRWPPALGNYDVLLEQGRNVRQGESANSRVDEVTAIDASRHIMGTPEQVVEQLEVLIARGCGGILSHPHDYPDTNTVRLLVEQVIPEFR